MSKVDKLSILGVRSFDNQHPETIQLYTPLTLIVGYNGSGKTTIIECLKYATIGDLPPNSKGGAFIHDPKICNEKEVLAQVKMSFNGTNGAKMVVTRSVQLTVKKATRVQKTLECQLLSIKGGERTSISSRVAELDQIMPQYLGVSKAVLDNVIFCHQDESLWPMSEPSVLKKKFDEIFEALKYTKALDNIKLLRKSQNDKLGNYKQTEEYMKANKDKGDRAEKKSRELDAELKTLRAEITQLEIEIKEAQSKHQEAFDHAAQYVQVADSLNLKQNHRDWLENTVKGLRQGLIERSESDEWLQAEVEQYDERLTAYERNKSEQAKHYENLTRSIDESRRNLSVRHSEAGRHEQQKVHHEQQIEKRKVLIKDSSRRHDIRGYDADLDDMQISEYVEKISRLCKEQLDAVEKVRRENEREVKKAQEMLSKLGERRSVLEADKNTAKQQSTANDRQIGNLHTDLNSIEIDEGGKAILESKIEDVEKRLNKAKSDSEKAAWDTKLQEKKFQLRAMEEESQQLNRDLVQSTKQAGELARLDHLRREVASLQRNIEKMKGVYGGRLQTLVSQNWQPSNLEASFQKVVDRKNSEIEEAKRHRDAVSRGLEQIDFKISNAKMNLKKGEQELAACVIRLEENVGGEPEQYIRVLSELQQARDVFKADFDSFEHMRDFYAKGITIAQKDSKCRLCQRGFHGTEQNGFISRMKAKLENETAAEVERDLSDAEEDLRRAKEAGPSYETWVRLSKAELPKLQEDLKNLGRDREKLLREIEEHDKIVKEYEHAKADVESLTKPVRDIVKYQQDLNNFSGQIKDLTENQKDTGLSRTLEDIQERLEVLDGKSRGLRNSIDKLTANKESARLQISALELELSREKSNLSNANHELDKKTGLLKRIEELRGANREHRDTVKRLDKQLQELAPQLSEQETKLSDIKQRGADKEKTLQEDASSYSDTVYKLELAEQTIQAYLDDGGPSKLAKCQRYIDNIQREIRQLEDEQKRVIKSINKISEELTNHEATKRTIVDNINYRHRLRELEGVKNEIAHLSAQNDEADRSSWQKQASHWKRVYDSFSTQKSSKLGAAKAKDDQLGQLIKDWETDYKDAAYLYKKAHIEVETTKAAVEDLGRYGGALDKAIMKYHSIKMEEINRIIEELWKKTYQGTDVDTILIRSDNEAAKGNRSYNYRVCMVKQDAEMDMRGRCSAGQKVLASIIIRLALAECFGVNCGLIALDEPTTNLDRDNIRSLAQSLHDIIEARRHQSNFQLIVITHDEDFLKQMKCPDFCDYYYRISRNDRQKSIIERQSIAEVM